MYDVAATLDPDDYFRLARATYGEMALAGITAVGEFHYLHHAPGGVAVRRRRTRWATPSSPRRARPASGSRCSTRATSAADPVSRSIPCSGASRTAAPTRGPSGPAALTPDAGVRVGAAVHSVRAVDPAVDRHRRRLGRASDACRCTPTCPSSPPRTSRCVAAHGATPVEVLAAAGALDARFTAVHATHVSPADIGLLGAARLLVLHLPDDRARPRRRHRADVRAARRRRPPDARQRLARRHRPARGGARRRAGRAPGVTPSAAATTSRRCCGWRPSTATPSIGWPDAGRIEAGALADLTTIGAGLRAHGRHAPGDALAGVVFAATAADVRHVVVGGRVVVRDGQHTALDVARELAPCWRDGSAAAMPT